MSDLFQNAPEMLIEPGGVLMQQGNQNRRLFLVRHGSFTGRRETLDGSESIELLRFGSGELIGVQSIFLNQHTSMLTITADSRSTVAYLDVADELPADFEKKLMPVLVRAMLRRQEQALHQSQLEKTAFLGQMAAAVAHELNNALAVVGRGAGWIGDAVAELMADGPKLPGAAFDHGFHQGRRSVPADELADKARTLRRQLKIGFGESRDLAKLDPPPDLQKAVAKDRKHLTTALKAHELGATLRDLDQAARQAQHVVTAMKQLGASARLREETVHINQSLKVALTITDVPRRGVDTRWAPTSEPILNANEGELVQIWSNLIKNACDAMKEHQAATGRAPVLTVESALDEAQGWVDVRISDNGPGIPESIRARMFEPNVTTKKRGLDFGLGLGLAIVQRLVTIYQGRIDCDTGPDGTTFTISLPLTRH